MWGRSISSIASFPGPRKIAARMVFMVLVLLTDGIGVGKPQQRWGGRNVLWKNVNDVDFRGGKLPKFFQVSFRDAAVGDNDVKVVDGTTRYDARWSNFEESIIRIRVSPISDSIFLRRAVSGEGCSSHPCARRQRRGWTRPRSGGRAGQ